MRWLIVALLVAPPSAAAPPVSRAKALEIYHTRCEKCHGPDGHAPQAGEGLSFADGEWSHGSDLKSVVEVITNGVPETGMNAFTGKLSPEEIQALAKYVRSLDKTLKK
jgi:cytochrome c oxidase cbb3-type subunit III